MSKQFSQFQSPRQYDIIIQNCLLKCLSSAQKVLQNSIAKALRRKIQQIYLSKEIITQAIQYFIFTLIGCIENLRQRLSLFQQKQKPKKSSQQNSGRQFDINDYQNLEKELQKIQGDIRKHIRLQQQMKLYMSDLQQNVQKLQKQLRYQNQNFEGILKNLEAVNYENKQLQSKLKRFQNKNSTLDRRHHQTHQSSLKPPIKPSKIKSEASLKDDTYMYRSSIDKNDIKNSLPKKKSLIQKINQRSRMLSKKQQSNNLLYVDSSIYVNLQRIHNESKHHNKKNSFDQQLKDNIKTVQLHQQVKKPHRRVIRFQTQSKEIKNQKKQQRSSSVFQ